ncbi:hypothetical protein NQ315_000327, partial [Exocentrus adspersus]
MEELPDRISEVFRDKTIFVTGATGFIGKVLVERLLRVADVKKLYFLIRRKKGKSPAERLQEIFSNVLFKRLLEQKPDAIKKCVPICGDVAELGLGMAAEDRELLKEEVNFIFHSAATTRFDETVRQAIIMNTRGTKLVLELAQECKHLTLFVYISTAYAFPKEEVTHERYYEPPADPHAVLKGIEWIKDDTMSNFNKIILGDIPNSYTFSKALAEALVHEHIGKMPFMIVRPAVVIPTIEDPFPGWCNNLQGPMGLFVGGGKGVIRSMYMDSKSHANFVPVDSAVSAMLVCIWNYLSNENAPYIINLCVPQRDIQINWEEIMLAGHDVINNKVPFNNILWYPGGTLTKSRLYNQINFVLFQLIPAVVVDFFLFLFSYKPILYDIQMRVHKGQVMFEYYTDKAWNFETKNIETIRRKLNAREKKIYEVERDVIDVKDYLAKCILSVRRNILKETDDMLPAARRNMKIMYVLDKVVKVAFLIAVAYYFYKWLLVPVLDILH